MKKVSLTIWSIILIVFTLGIYALWIFLAECIIFLLVLWLKPEWIDRYL